MVIPVEIRISVFVIPPPAQQGYHFTTMLLRSFPIVAILSIALQASAALPERVEPVRDFTITAGNAFFDQSPAIGSLCTFDFGDPAGAYNILTGFNAAHIYDKPGDYKLKVTRVGEVVTKTIHVLPDKRPVQHVEPRESLRDVAIAAQNDSIVELSRGATYDIPGPLDIKARNVAFRAAAGGGPAPRIRRIVGNGSSSLIVHGLDTVFRGIEFDSDQDMKVVGNKKVGLRGITPDTAHVVMVNCTFRNLDDAIFCTPLTRGILVQYCHFTDETRSCGVWADGSNIVLLGNHMATSQREHNVRQSHPGFYNMLVFDNDMVASHGKETLTFRLGQDLYAAQNAFHGWVRVGPGPRADHRAMTPEELRKAFVRYVVIERNAFTGQAWLQINEGTSEVMVRCNRIDVDNQGVPVRLQGPSLSNIVLEDNYRVLTAGPTKKPFYRGWTTGPNDVLERGTTNKTEAEAEALRGKPKSE